MKCLLGIDGGGTRTRAVFATEMGEIIGCGVSGPSNFLSVGLEKAISNIADSIKQAVHTGQTVSHLTLGLAGVGRPNDHAQMFEALKSRFVSEIEGITLTTDAHIALTGAVEGQNGIVVIAGTGAIALGVKDGFLERAGGWGYILDDRGSGYDLGRRAITAALRHFDGRGMETALTEQICQHYQVQSITELIAPIYQGQIDRVRIAELAPLIATVAEEGDTVACKILQDGGRELAFAALAVAKRLGLTRRFKIAGTGGLLKNHLTGLYSAYEKELVSQLPEVEISSPVFEPVYGALLLAAQEKGITTEPMIRRWKNDHEIEFTQAK